MTANFSPLKGIRVLDLTSVVVGPVVTGRLAQYGAEVIKLESPEGDLMRGLGGLSPTGQHSGAYLHFNRGKRNICLDIKKPAARKLLDKLIAASDVIVANMRPQALLKLGLDAETIREKFPQKIYCLITGYGSDGCYAGLPTYDSVVQGATGMGGLFLARDGSPSYVPLLICDHVVGEITTSAVLAAILELKLNGNGSTLEVPMFETMAAFVLQEHLAQHSFVPPVGKMGDQRLLSPHNKPVKTKDGYISFTINTDSQVKAFLKATNREVLINDTRYNSVGARAKNNNDWFAIRGAALLDKTTQEWLMLFKAADIAAMPCHTLETLREDPHLNQVGMFIEDHHPTEGKTIALRSSIRVNNTPLNLCSFSQPKGYETRAVMQEFGMEADEIAGILEKII